MRSSTATSIFSVTLSGCIAILYWFLRIGFLENSLLIIAKVVGLGAFILLIPTAFSFLRVFFSKQVNKTFFNQTILPIYGLAFIACVGWLSSFIRVDFSFVFSVAGYILLIIECKKFFKENAVQDVLLILGIAGFFACWVGPVCWVFGYLKPYIIEGWAVVGTDRSDTPFHLAIAQMLKTYGVPSTGLDGIPAMNYHWGSHWFFAQLSNLLHLPVTVIYQLCYPAIIAPLLFRTFLSFVLEMKEASGRDNQSKSGFNFTFWMIFLAIFIGLFVSYWAGNKWAENTGTGTGATAFILTSESYAFSIMLMFGLFGCAHNYWLHRDSLSRAQNVLILFLIFPVLISVIGLVKVSTLFMVCSLAGYLFLRLGMYKKWLLFASMAVICITALFVALLVFEPRENHGSLSWFFFYRSRDISLPLYLFLFYIWTYIFIVIFFVSRRLHKSERHQVNNSPKTLPLECVIWVAVTGFLPGMVLRIQNYDALYFTEIQLLLAASLVLLYIPFYRTHWKQNTVKVWLIRAAMAILAVIFVINTYAYLSHSVGDSINHHASILSRADKRANNSKPLRIREIIRTYLTDPSAVQNAYSRQPDLSFYRALAELDTLSLDEKRKSLIYVDFRSLFRDQNYSWKLYCSNIPFVVPGLTGIAMIDGIDVTYFEMCGGCCENTGFSYQYYPKWKSISEIEKPFNVNNVCERVLERGFDQLFYYNLERKVFEKIECPSRKKPNLCPQRKA